MRLCLSVVVTNDNTFDDAVGDAYGMSMHEFGHFIHATGAINYKNQAKKLGGIIYSDIVPSS